MDPSDGDLNEEMDHADPDNEPRPEEPDSTTEVLARISFGDSLLLTAIILALVLVMTYFLGGWETPETRDLTVFLIVFVTVVTLGLPWGARLWRIPAVRSGVQFTGCGAIAAFFIWLLVYSFESDDVTVFSVMLCSAWTITFGSISIAGLFKLFGSHSYNDGFESAAFVGFLIFVLALVVGGVLDLFENRAPDYEFLRTSAAGSVAVTLYAIPVLLGVMAFLVRPRKEIFDGLPLLLLWPLLLVISGGWLFAPVGLLFIGVLLVGESIGLKHGHPYAGAWAAAGIFIAVLIIVGLAAHMLPRFFRRTNSGAS